MSVIVHVEILPNPPHPPANRNNKFLLHHSESRVRLVPLRGFAASREPKPARGTACLTRSREGREEKRERGLISQFSREPGRGA